MRHFTAAVFLALLAFILAAAPRASAAGVSHYSIGASTGTNLIVLATTPETFWGLSVSSAAAGDFFKCWDSTSTSGLTAASVATLAATMYQTTVQPGPAASPVQAVNGVVCGKTSTSSEALVYFNP